MSWILPKHLEALVLNQNLHLVEITSGAIRFVDSSVAMTLGTDIREIFPELFGIEDILAEVMAGTRDEFSIKSIGRTTTAHFIWYFDIYCVCHPHKIETQGNQALILFLEEVTERMRLEQTLVQATNETHLLLGTLALAKENIDKIIASMAEALLVISNSGIIKRVNQAAQNLLGYTREELVEHSLTFIATEDAEILNKFIAPVGESADEWEVTCRKKTGEKIIISFSRSIIKTDIKGASGQRDTLQEFVYIGRDVTEQKRRQKRLAAQHAVSEILSESVTATEALSRVLQTLGKTLEWQIGELWMMGETGVNLQELRCIEVWNATPHSSQQQLSANEMSSPISCSTFTPGVCLPQLILADGKPKWFSDIIAEAFFIGSHLITSGNLHAAFGFPIQTDKQVLGVMTFFSREVLEHDDDLIQIGATLGNQLGQYLQRKRAEEALRLEREKTERLLLNILPEPIAERLKRDTRTIAEQFAEVSVLFADLVGFTEMASTLSPIELVELLNEIFSEFDELTGKQGLEKIKTIGDAYMVVAGLPTPRADHAIAIAEMALDMQQAMLSFNEKNSKKLSIRIGIHSGPVVAGVIGLKKFIYDLWGDTVNIASRMESHGIADCIQVSDTTYQLLQARYCLEERGIISVKGKGQMMTYLLVSRIEKLI